MKGMILDIMAEAGGSMETVLRRLKVVKGAIRVKAKDANKRLKRKKLAAETLRHNDQGCSLAGAASVPRPTGGQLAQAESYIPDDSGE